MLGLRRIFFDSEVTYFMFPDLPIFLCSFIISDQVSTDIMAPLSLELTSNWTTSCPYSEKFSVSFLYML